MRVLTVGSMYPPHSLGGYELMWQSSVRQLRAAGHRVRVLASDHHEAELADPPHDDPDVHRELRWYWRNHGFPPIGRLERVRLERHNRRALLRHLGDFRPDVVCWWAMGGMSLSLLEQVRQAELPALAVVVDHWPIYAREKDAWTRLGHRRVVGAVCAAITRVPTRVEFARCSDWLFASESLRQSTIPHGLGLESGRVAHPGVDQELFHPGRASRNAWNWHLLYCGRLEPRKGVDLAIEALAALPAEAQLTIAGRGDLQYRRELDSLIDALGVAGRVRFETPERSDLPRVYARADVTLFPVTWPEPFGLVPLESMAMGTPVVASGRGGSAEYLVDADNCVLFDPDSGGAGLAAAIRRLATAEVLRERLSRRGIETSARFDARKFNRAVERSLVAAAERRPS